MASNGKKEVCKKDTPIEIITIVVARKDAMEPQLTENGNIKDVEKEFIQLDLKISH
jgi:hypothetical protein